MKRRSFLQMAGGAMAALFVPKVAAKANDDYLVDPDRWFIKAGSGDLSESALEDVVVELNEFRAITGKRIAFEPTQLLCYPKDLDDARRIVGMGGDYL